MTTSKFLGLNAQNPLGFLASLGLLRILADHARRKGAAPPRLCFIDEGQMVAQVTSHLDGAAIKDLILTDAAEQIHSPAIQLSYIEADSKKKQTKRVSDLRPPPSEARRFLLQMQSAPRREADLAAGFFSDLIQDDSQGRTKPTALHFTSGQQKFLAMVEDLRKGLILEDLDEALDGPWLNRADDRALPSLSWDSSASRIYALRATNPAEETRGSVAGANWLAVHGMGFFTVFVRGKHLQTTAVTRDAGKTWMLTWPLWTAPATAETIAALLRYDAGRWTASQRAACSIFRVCQSKILRANKGYGSFLPSSVIPPPSN